MEFKRMGEMLWELVRADEGPERKLEELLSELEVTDRVLLLDYIVKEHKRGIIESMISQRLEHEEPPEGMDLPPEALTRRDAYFLHLTHLSDRLNKMCSTTVPAKLQEYEKDIAEFRQRKKVLDTLKTNVREAESTEKLLSTTEAAEFLGCTVSTIYSYNHSGMLKPSTIGGKKNFYSVGELVKLRRKKDS